MLVSFSPQLHTLLFKCVFSGNFAHASQFIFLLLCFECVLVCEWHGETVSTLSPYEKCIRNYINYYYYCCYLKNITEFLFKI